MQRKADFILSCSIPRTEFNKALSPPTNALRLLKGRNQWILETALCEGGVRVCGIAVLGYFWCGFAVIFFSKHGNAVFKVQAVRGNFKFYVAVIGEKIVVSR